MGLGLGRQFREEAILSDFDIFPNSDPENLRNLIEVSEGTKGSCPR